jgi:hypothetical protein
MNNNNNKQIKDELVKAIKVFVDRQYLVAKAIESMGLNLDLVGKYGSFSWTLDDEIIDLVNKNGIKSVPSELRDIVTERMSNNNSLLQTGTWYDENNNLWEFFLHGNGCRLTDSKTGEIIDWDCPRISRFDVSKFYRHLEWQIKVFPDNYSQLSLWLLDNGISGIHRLLRELILEGVIDKDNVVGLIK